MSETGPTIHLQFYCNGHARLAAQLTDQHIAYELLDNAFSHVADYEQANQKADPPLRGAWRHERSNHGANQ